MTSTRSGSPGQGCPMPPSTADVRAPERRQRGSVWRQRPAHEADALSDGHQVGQEFVASLAVQGALIEAIDALLEVFDKELIAGDDLVSETREQVGGVQRADRRLPAQ